jgi:CDGSH-type Zn-finger protein
MRKHPYSVSIKKGKNYAWCECAKSKSQPFCDGSHTKENKRNENLLENLQEISFISKDSKIIVADTMEPVIFSTDKDIEVSLCGCKESNNVPYCSGAHVNI